MIRMAREGDIPQLLKIYNEEILHGVATFDLEEKTVEEWTVWYHMHKGNYALRVWEEDGLAVGYVSLSPYREKEAYQGTAELSVYIQKEYRHRGIGRKLIEEILRIARENPILHTVVSVITAGNQVSTELHETLGFSYCGRVCEAGYKFGTYLDIETYQIMVGETK